MIPGWPPPRLRDVLAARLLGVKALVESHADISDEEMAVYLANFGVDERVLARIVVDRSRPEAPRDVISMLLTLIMALSAVLGCLRHDLASLVDLEDDGAGGAGLGMAESPTRLRI
jgi:hypothetical protein